MVDVAAFAVAADVSASAEMNRAAGESGELADTQTGLDRDEEQGVISATGVGGAIGGGEQRRCLQALRPHPVAPRRCSPARRPPCRGPAGARRRRPPRIGLLDVRAQHAGLYPQAVRGPPTANQARAAVNALERLYGTD